MAITERIAEWGLKNLAFAPIIKENGVITGFGTPFMHPGAITLNISAGNSSDNGLAADDGRYYGGSGSKTKTGELTVARFLNKFRTDIMGEMDFDGMLVEGDATQVEFAMLWEVSDNQGGNRNIWYDCTAGDITKNNQTTAIDGTVTYGTETSTITSTMAELPNGVVARKATVPKGDPRYDAFFEAVVLPESTTPETAPKLSALAVGSLTLTPAFDADTTTYAATTTNASDAVTFTAPLGVTVAATANGASIASGDSVTWNEGDNTVTVTLTGATASTTYTVTVTKE